EVRVIKEKKAGEPVITKIGCPAAPALSLLILAGTRAHRAPVKPSSLELRGFWSKCCTIVNRTIRADIHHRTNRSRKNPENSDNSTNSMGKPGRVRGVE